MVTPTFASLVCGALTASLLTTTQSTYYMSSTSDTAPPSMTSFDSISDSEAAWVLSSPPTTGQKSEHPSRVPTPGLHDEPVKHPRFYYKDGSLSFCVRILLNWTS